MKFPFIYSLACILAVLSTGATVCAWTINLLLERWQSAALRHFIWLLALTVPLAAVPIFSLPARVRVPLFAASGPHAAGTDPVPRRPVVVVTQTVVAARGPRRPALLPPPASATGIGRAFNALIIRTWPALWLGVAGLLVIRLCAGTISVARTLKTSCVPAGAGLVVRLRESATALRLANPPRLFVSQSRKIPFCYGILRPAIVIPEDIAAEGRLLDFCLKHELAHIVRRDLLCLFAAYLSCALCWFNPLVWLALRRLRDEAEAAADDLVLAHHPQPGDYAASLLSIAEASCHAATPTLAFSMARPNRLRCRLVAILDATLPRRAPGRGTLAAMAMLAVLALYISLSVRLAAAEPTPAPVSGAASPPYESGTFKVQVVDEQGQPIRDANVLPDNCYSKGTGTWWCDPLTGEKASDTHLAFSTGADGEATITYPIYLGGTDHELRTARVNYHVWADGYGEAIGTCEVSEGVSKVTLIKGTTVTLRAISPEGAVLPKPRAVLGHADIFRRWMDWQHAPDQATLVSARPFTPGTHYVMAVTADAAGVLSFSEVRQFTAADAVSRLALDLPVRRGRDVTASLDASVPRPVRDGRVLAFVVPEAGRDADGDPIQLSWKMNASIRADGTFTLANLPPGELHVTAICDGSVTADKQHGVSLNPQVFAPDAALPLVLKMEPTGDVRVRVRETNGNPMVGAKVVFNPNEESDLEMRGILGNAYSSVTDFDKEYDEKFPSHEELPERRVHQYMARTDDKGEAVIFDLPMGERGFQITDASGRRLEAASVNVKPGKETAVEIDAQ